MRVHLRETEVAGDHSVKKSETVTYCNMFLLLACWGKRCVSCCFLFRTRQRQHANSPNLWRLWEATYKRSCETKKLRTTVWLYRYGYVFSGPWGLSLHLLSWTELTDKGSGTNYSSTVSGRLKYWLVMFMPLTHSILFKWSRKRKIFSLSMLEAKS